MPYIQLVPGQKNRLIENIYELCKLIDFRPKKIVQVGAASSEPDFEFIDFIKQGSKAILIEPHPDFYSEFRKEFPELSIESENAFDVLYGSEIGKIARIFGFGLKDKISNVIQMVKFLISSKNPYDILEENSKNKTMHRRFNEIEKKYSKLLEKAKEALGWKPTVSFKELVAMMVKADINLLKKNSR